MAIVRVKSIYVCGDGDGDDGDFDVDVDQHRANRGHTHRKQRKINIKIVSYDTIRFDASALMYIYVTK